MNLLLLPNQVERHTLYFDAAQPNIVMANSEFSRLIYSNNFLSTSGLLALLHLDVTSHSIYYNKHRLYFKTDSEFNLRTVMDLQNLETLILNSFYAPDKVSVHKLRRQLSNGFIRIYSEDKITRSGIIALSLKVSGVWCTESEYGITFKFTLHQDSLN